MRRSIAYFVRALSTDRGFCIAVIGWLLILLGMVVRNIWVYQ
jgi:hypothetical protein